MARPSGRDIRQEVLREATNAIRSHGVSGFSYGDLANRVGVRAPSIHHHFQHKDDLIAEATADYRLSFRDAVEKLDAPSPIDRLRQYSRLFLSPAAEGVLCLCGAAVAGWDELNPTAQAEISAFFQAEVTWVAEQLDLAAEQGEIRSTIDTGRLALSLIAALEGALLLARTGVGAAAPTDAFDGVLDMALAGG